MNSTCLLKINVCFEIIDFVFQLFAQKIPLNVLNHIIFVRSRMVLTIIKI